MSVIHELFVDGCILGIDATSVYTVTWCVGRIWARDEACHASTVAHELHDVLVLVIHCV